MDEFEKIARIKEVLGGATSGVALGIGDDAAVLERPTGPVVLSVDSAVEGVHFRLDFGPPRALGRRSTVAALSDLAAMGARPLAMLSNIQLPADFPDETLLEIVRGQGDAASEYSAPVVGGNLSAGNGLAITTTVVGQLDGPALQRCGAQVGDLICCSGVIGAAALGLQLKLQGHSSQAVATFMHAFLWPNARIDLGLSLSGVASACVDISDGLFQDLQHLCSASKVGALLEYPRIPRHPDFESTALDANLDPVALCLGGGEDYELLFTLPKATSVPRGTYAIGEIVAEKHGVQVVDDAGQRVAPPSGGFRHFS